MTPQERQAWVRRMGARRDWWDSRPEDIVEPAWEFVDAHVHLWEERDFPDPSGDVEPVRTSRYMLPELIADAGAGHRVTDFVYVECGSGYRTAGPSHLRASGEAEFALRQAEALSDGDAGTRIGAAVCHAGLADPGLDELLDAYDAVGGGLVSGIRQSGARLEDPSTRLLAGAARPGLYADPAFLRGLASLGERELTFDAFLFHFQLDELAEMSRQAPDTTIVVNHAGAPIGYTGAAGPGDAVFDAWARQIERIADLPNLVLKLGGLASIVTGYDAHLRERPPSSEEFLAERGAYFRHAIGLFGAARCMFESNFPVDGASIGYRTLWNAYKILAAEHGSEDRRALLGETARKTYRIAARNVHEGRGDNDAAA
ncbi:MAG: amidohydrolase family protein [Mesorhizobium sp.]|nr:amidohydrolase family protein [Mesorhizobium sp.]